MSVQMLPDGHGVPPEALELMTGREPIHLRLTAVDGSTARGACDFGLGQWWTGKPSEVTCVWCLEVVHA